MDTPDDLITATEAQKLLQTSPNKIAALIKERRLTAYEDPLDKRVKLVSRSEVESLKIRKRAA
jgi:hypothetical protein